MWIQLSGSNIQNLTNNLWDPYFYSSDNANSTKWLQRKMYENVSALISGLNKNVVGVDSTLGIIKGPLCRSPRLFASHYWPFSVLQWVIHKDCAQLQADLNTLIMFSCRNAIINTWGKHFMTSLKEGELIFFFNHLLCPRNQYIFFKSRTAL